MTILDITKDEGTALEQACDVLAAGGLVALPTETVYGLAADATNGEAVVRIFEVKGRPRFNPLICHMADIDMAGRYVAFSEEAERLADLFWPGPLTLVLPLKPDAGIHSLTAAGLDTLAVRVPTGFAGRLIGRYDRPLAAPSANTSGRISSTTAAHVETDLGDRVGLILDAGPARIGLESTILKPTGEGVELLRPGGLSAADIESAIGAPLMRRSEPGAAVEAPGMLRSHYAPGKSLRINAASAGEDDAVITFAGQRVEGAQAAKLVLDLSPSGDLAEAAANLFDYMKRADGAATGEIVVAAVPKTGLGEAINDRLERAAAPRRQS